jgi:putative PEP-CTERM system histidine kinase
MEYNSVTYTAYICAAITSLLLAIQLFFLSKQRRLTLSLTAAASIQMLCLINIGLAFDRLPISPYWVLTIECLHYSFWTYAIYRTLIHSQNSHAPPLLRQLFYISNGISLLVLISGLLSLQQVFIYSGWLVLLQAVISLVCCEQLFRNAGSQRHIKLLSVGLIAVFLYNIYLYTHTLIFQQISPLLWQVRAAIWIACGLFIIIGLQTLATRQEPTFNLAPSRSMAFYTTSLIGSGLLITVLAIGGLYVRNYGGSWGTILYSLILASGGLLIATLFLSTSMRATLSVQINKHFFRHKYDYRSEWLKLINYLDQPTASEDINRRAFHAVSSIVKSPGGAVWVRYGDHYEPVYSKGLPNNFNLSREHYESSFCKSFLQSEWVYFPDSGNNLALSKHNEYLPEWSHNFPDLWLIFPLLAADELVGFIALTRPQVNLGFSWEDLDLLKAVGRQLANYIQTHHQAESLAEAMQIDTYNKLVHFIIHDLNNLITQQALVVQNANKHKHNPAFIEDAIDTISNSVDRMKRLLGKLRREEGDGVKHLPVNLLLSSASASCQSHTPTPQLSLTRCNCAVQADQTRLTLAISHFIKNAQEATDDNGSVTVTHTCDCKNEATITIQDSGSGMDWDFIHHRLFKAFESTKSGMGIGVYLSREYINDLNGSLDVYSQPGQGSTFTIKLPIQADL